MTWYTSAAGYGGLVGTTGATSAAASGWSTGGSSGGGFWSSVLNGVGNYFGGGSSGGGSSGGGMNWGSLLASGASGAAGAMMDEKTMREKGKQDRLTTAYEAQLADYYKQKDKKRKRVALDTYGQFKLTNRWAPNMQASAPVEVPEAPTP